MGNHRLPIISHNHRYRLITRKYQTRILIFLAYPSTVNCHQWRWGDIVSPMGDIFLLFTTTNRYAYNYTL